MLLLRREHVSQVIQDDGRESGTPQFPCHGEAALQVYLAGLRPPNRDVHGAEARQDRGDPPRITRFLSELQNGVEDFDWLLVLAERRIALGQVGQRCHLLAELAHSSV